MEKFVDHIDHRLVCDPDLTFDSVLPRNFLSGGTVGGAAGAPPLLKNGKNIRCCLA